MTQPTIQAHSLRVCRLDADGQPTGDWVELANAGFTMTTKPTPLTDPKEHTDMTTTPEARPSKALVRELREQLASRDRQLASASMDLRTSEDRRKAAEAIDWEAKALADCVAAIDAMHKAEADANRNRSAMGYTTVARYGHHGQPEAYGIPTGRILLHLAARYGVPIAPTQPPERTGPTLAMVPPDLADSLRQLLDHGWPQ